MQNKRAKNILGGPLQSCSLDPMTGYFRDGCCHTDENDHGSHTVCALMTEDFLTFSVSMGNDLVTPRPEYHFPGLKPGDRWCVCAARWLQAYHAGVAPPVYLEATNEKATDFVPVSALLENSVDQSG